MHKHSQSGEPVNAPEPVQRAKNLVEEFFGLSLADAEFSPQEFLAAATGAVIIPAQATDYYHTRLLSSTGRELAAFVFLDRRKDGWVTIEGGKHDRWGKALQTAIDNFINNPKGGFGVLGEFRPTADKLNAAR